VPGPVDQAEGPRFALRGRVVTMDAHDAVHPDAVVYVEAGSIAAVRQPAAAPPDGFEQIAPVAVRGTIYPGLVDLHNHLPYDVLPLWQVPKRYDNRGQWGSGNQVYRRLVTGPMAALGGDPQLMPAVVRYVECKALAGGVTTSQGIALFSNAGARRFYRGLVRNVEDTDDPRLPEVATRIADVVAADAERFLGRLRTRKLLLHLAEGVDESARRHFLALQYAPGKWAINENLIGIHCAALQRPDFDVLAAHGGSMVWSPLSNLLLYGGTADVAAARAAGVRISVGSDWSPSGSKNLLDELKAARLASDRAGGVFTDRELVAMVTRVPASMLGWEAALGSIEAGRYADLLVVSGRAGDPYTDLVDARDRDIRLVVVAGRPRYGVPSLMSALVVAAGERLRLGGLDRVVDLAHRAADPLVAGLTYAAARDRLKAAFAGFVTPDESLGGSADSDSPHWMLALDELAATGFEVRPRLPAPREPALAESAGAAAEPSQPSGPQLDGLAEVRAAAREFLAGSFEGARRPDVRLDRLTVADDRGFLDDVIGEANLPSGFGKSLADRLH
jgi:5-methylthioadenosine/S-adenosylhomocysteine deaminase